MSSFIWNIVLVVFCIGILHGAVVGNGKGLKQVKDKTKGKVCKERWSGFRAHNIEINESCKKGQIRWTLTKRYLNLTLKVSDTKELCFSSRAPKGLQKYTVYERVGEKLEELGTPSKGLDTCTVVNKGTNKFRINPTGLYFGLYVRYTLVTKGKI